MDSLSEIDLIINKKKYPKIYNGHLIILGIILISIYILSVFKYQSYYITKGKITNNLILLYVDINDIKYIKKSGSLFVNNNYYKYELVSVSNQLYVSNEYDNYYLVYIKVNNLINVDNYVYEIKILKESKTLVKYLKDYL